MGVLAQDVLGLDFLYVVACATMMHAVNVEYGQKACIAAVGGVATPTARWRCDAPPSRCWGGRQPRAAPSHENAAVGRSLARRPDASSRRRLWSPLQRRLESLHQQLKHNTLPPLVSPHNAPAAYSTPCRPRSRRRSRSCQRGGSCGRARRRRGERRVVAAAAAVAVLACCYTRADGSESFTRKDVSALLGQCRVRFALCTSWCAALRAVSCFLLRFALLEAAGC